MKIIQDRDPGDEDDGEECLRRQAVQSYIQIVLPEHFKELEWIMGNSYSFIRDGGSKPK